MILFDDRLPYEIKSSITIECALELEKTHGQVIIYRFCTETSKRDFSKLKS
jgi:hypothetical protein